MKIWILSASLFCAASTLAATEAPAVQGDDIHPSAIRPCARCVEARENNLKHPNEYFYYEDYVEATNKKQKQ